MTPALSASRQAGRPSAGPTRYFGGVALGGLAVNLNRTPAGLDAQTSGDAKMKFISLKSRGGDYLVVASNIAWLRSYENGQTKVGIVGSDSLLVAGSIEEIAAAILAG